MTSTHLLRIEGVNLGHFVFDTRDLSTNRGGSLLLLDAVDHVISALETSLGTGNFEVLSRGASMGLFAIDSDQPEAVANAVRSALSGGDFAHATFAVDVAAVSGFRDDVESLLAANRWRQMQAASLSLPSVAGTCDWSQPACDLDGLRPISGSHRLRNKQLSDSVWRRREYGRTKKRSFYEKLTGLKNLSGFANDFESIAVGSQPLGGKLAVFYADGNGFGGIQAQHCSDHTKQKDFDQLIRDKRAAMLTAFLKDEVQVAKWTTSGNRSRWAGVQKGEADKGEECVRFETLLWGGDEVMFVMPAALGWRFAAFFFKQMEGMTFAGQTLSHAAALVFCQHHSPIYRIKRLAKDQMAEFAKSTDRQHDSLVVTALESFDHLGTCYKKAMSDRYGGAVALEKMILSASGQSGLGRHLNELSIHFDALRKSETFARSQLRSLVHEMLENPASAAFIDGTDEAGSPIKSPPAHFRNASKQEKERLAILLGLLGNDPAVLWLQLEELWDYALP